MVEKKTVAVKITLHHDQAEYQAGEMALPGAVRIYRVPSRTIRDSRQLKYILDLDMVDEEGVYFFIGANSNGAPRIYVGQSQEISSRIRTHISLADECVQMASEMVIIVGRGLDPKIVKILEREFCQLATENSNGSLLNRQSPKPQKKIDKALQNAIDAFLAESLSILEAMGIWFFSPQTIQQAESTPSRQDSIELFLRIRDGQARGRMEGDKFIVLAGSDVVHEASEEKMSKSLWKLRQQLIKSGKIVNFKLQEDVEFGSPSGAGQFVSGHGMNGLDSWKDANKRTLHDLNSNTE